MIWGILGALEQEVVLIKDQMAVEQTVELYGNTCYIGTVGHQQVNVTICGIGKVNAAACATSMIRELHAQAIVNVGVAGAVGGGLKPLDVVISDEVVYHDFDPEILTKYYPNCSVFPADSHLVDLCLRAIEGRADRTYAHAVGRVATGDQFIGDRAVKEDIVRRLHPLCVEMEGAAIAHVAYMNEVPFVVIRAMSDSADDEAEESFDQLVAPAAQNSAQLVLDMLRLAE